MPHTTAAMSTVTFHRDAFTCWLEQHSAAIQPKVYQPGGFLGAPPIGWEIPIGCTRFVYRIPPDTPDVFYIVLIERLGGRHALHSPFADMVRLLQLVQRSETGIRFIRGHVEPSHRRPDDALSRERIIAFYSRYLTAVAVGIENGVEWYGGNLPAFSWSEEKRRIRSSVGRNRPTSPVEAAALP